MSRFERFAEPPAEPKAHAWDMADLGVVIGLVAVIAGVALIHLPSAFILGGAVLVAVVILAGGKQ